MARHQLDKPTHQPSISECARTGRPFIDLPYDPDNALRQVLLYFAANYDYIPVIRLQRLCFYTDYRYYQLHSEQLTDVNYQVDTYGVTSSEIHRELKNSPFEITGRSAPWSSDPGINSDLTSTSAIDSTLREFLNQIHEETRTLSPNDLRTFSRNTPLFKHTSTDSTAEFNDTTVASLDSYPI